MRNVTKLVFSSIVIAVLLGFTQMSNVSATSTSNPSIFEILSNGDITFVGAGTTKMIIIGPENFALHNSLTVTSIVLDANSVTILSPSAIYAPVDLPDGATITGFECKVQNTGILLACSLKERTYSDNSLTEISKLSTPLFDSIQTLTSDPLNYSVDRDDNRYFVEFRPNAPVGQCGGFTCKLFAMKITYTIPSGFAIGGNFYPVDNVSLILAYGLVNSWWMAPIGIGIGVGVYLTRNRWQRR